MDDYGIYIWSSYAVTAGTMLLMLGWSIIQFKQAQGRLSELEDNGSTKRPFKK
ncbi:heme exporter protein CcmD [Alphaproteobacteria bacterium]|nr:heme exporter protein CcmD [Alphaproteobacteria bacterium]